MDHVVTKRRIAALFSLSDAVRLLLVVLLTSYVQQIQGAVGTTGPLIGPDVMSLGTLPQLTFLFHPKYTTLITQTGLPAPQGTDFEGPDPGLNAAIISAPEVCPNNYMRDAGGRCRPAFSYGPNPLSTFTPEKYKGSIQFYMGLQQIGRPMNRRRNFQRMRHGGAGVRRFNRVQFPLRTPPPRVAATTTTLPPPPPQLQDRVMVIDQQDHDRAAPSKEKESHPLLPTPPPLTEPVAQITAILEALNHDKSSSAAHDEFNNEKSSSDSQTSIDDDDD
ncbi:hypothetical protein FHG87_006668 [Trinorchestia longiramus]|nr:hypothetical protein FHG87_006668 [Trinorchestia longiramus]